MSVATFVLSAAAVALALIVGVTYGSRRQLRSLGERLGLNVNDIEPDIVARVERERVRARDHELVAQTQFRRLHVALDQVTQGVVVCDATGAVLHANRFADSYLEGHHGRALVAEALRELVATATRAGRAEREVELFGPPARTFLVSAHRLLDADEPIGVVALIDDVTELHRLDAVRRDFVANVSHELKTPVGAMSLLAETLVDETDPATIRQLVDRIGAESLRLGRLVNDLLDLSRLESPASPPFQAEAMGTMVAEACEALTEQVSAQSVTLDVVVPAVDPTIVCDRHQIVSALRNLIDNAITHSESGGTVQVRVASSADDVAVAVQDHGVGIPAGSLDRIFERFYRVDRARSRVTGGTGLGLSIVRHVAVNHNGSVHVVSQEGLGSTFTLVIPVEPARAGDADLRPSPQSTES